MHIRADTAPAFHRKECLQRYRDKKQRRHFSHKVRLPRVLLPCHTLNSELPYMHCLHVGMLLTSDLLVQRSHRILVTVIISMCIWLLSMQINMTLSYRAVAEGYLRCR